MGIYLILNEDIVENIILAEDDASAALAATDGKTFIEIQQPPALPPMGKRYINGEYVEITTEPTVEI